MRTVLAAGPARAALAAIRKSLGNAYQILFSETLESALDLYQKHRVEYCFVDAGFLAGESRDENGPSALQAFWRIQPEGEIIVMASPDQVRDAVQLVKAGASAYLIYPLEPVEIRHLIDSIQKDIKLQEELKFFRHQAWNRDSSGLLKTRSPQMQAVFEKIRAVSRTDSTVLITGETGTGKGVIANLIHQHSLRSEKQFIPVHCGAIPDTLLESELFGHEKGAFTGAIRRKLGKFELAQGGTLFLDEIGTISRSMQIKMLQVLQEKTFQRVGGESFITADVRILSATNADLKHLVQQDRFRSDLFYRLNVFPLEIPPLRDRIEDIPILLEHFIARLNKFHNRAIKDVHPRVLQSLMAYDWPGNIRELENLIERAFIIEPSSVLSPDSFPAEFFKTGPDQGPVQIDMSRPLAEARREAVESAERNYLDRLLTLYQGRIGRTAEHAGVGVRQLNKLMTRYGLDKNRYKPDRQFEETGTPDSDIVPDPE